MINEIWKPVKHYEGLYEVSNYGRVKSLLRTVYRPDGCICGYVTEHYMTQHDNGNGYLFVNLWKNNKGKREYVHRLVALAFIDNPKQFPQVNHKDEDKQNNYVDNLEWCDCKYNNNYGTAKLRRVNTSIKHGVFEQFSKRMKANNPNKGQFKRGNNAYARKGECGGIQFNCIKDCAEYYGINYGTMRGWLSGSGNIPKHFKIYNLHYI